MNIYKGFDDYSYDRAACVTTGTFDGVHVGHKMLLQKLAKHASQSNLESILVTFDPHPRKVLFPEQEGLSLINTLDEKLELLESVGLDSVIVQPFTTEFSRTTALHYVRDLLVSKVGMKKLVIGYDHQFGKNREGSIENLKEMAPVYDFEVDEIPVQVVDDANVSSTKIRYALTDGNVKEANAYLGYAFFVSGKVVSGEGRGKGLGFPTANLQVAEDKVIPKNGVYAVDIVMAGNQMKGVVNIGNKPTFGDQLTSTIEVHILDFDDDLYSKQMRVVFKDRIRDEIRFDSSDLLRAQIAKDARLASDM